METENNIINNEPNEQKNVKSTKNKRVIKTTRDMAYIAIFTVLITVCAWTSIPFTIPLTLQTFAVFATLLMLGGKRGTISILAYILLGCVGAPVFSGFRGGFGVIMSATGGYIIGFLAQGLIYMLFEAIFKDNQWASLTALVIGLFACYAFGTAWYMIVYLQNSKATSILAVLSNCVFPFIVPDLAKLGLAYLLTFKIRKYIK